MSWDKEELVPLRALANPLRIRIVSLLTGTAMSATEVAEELGIAHGSASYHLRQLAAAGFLRRADPAEPSGRGQPPRRYTYDPSNEERLDRSGDAQVVVHEAAATDLRRRLEAMTDRRVMADAEVWLPRESWERAVALVEEAVRLVHDRAGEPRADGSVRVSMTATLFELS
ncbi:winged helix-turn-helix domain-containing protein [Phytomonospora sp. NPDC050363]|uniref:winged helix-turn-helix domain-containing protein n=1 Tax=Phytomonospora sp. NPDC050363 TaxID=3155642 RepID=UPI00340472C4